MKSRRWMYPVAGLVLVGLAALLIATVTRSSSGNAPDFELALFDPQAGTISDRTLRLSDFKGQPVVLNFWASWCPPCRAETPQLVETYEEYRVKGVQFIGVDVWTGGESVRSATGFLREYNVSYPTGPDLTGEVFPSYVEGPLSFNSVVPITVFITRDQRILKTWAGLIDRDSLVYLVEQLVQG